MVPPGNMTGMYKFTRMSTSHFLSVKRSVVDSGGYNANEAGWKNTRAKETFGADSEDVSV